MIDRINLLMRAKNLTAKQFAEEIGVQPSGMSHILSGRNKPSLDFIMKVINRFPEIDIHWLLHGTGEMYSLSSRLANSPKVEVSQPVLYNQVPMKEPSINHNAISQPVATVAEDSQNSIQTEQHMPNKPMTNSPTLFDTFDEDSLRFVDEDVAKVAPAVLPTPPRTATTVLANASMQPQSTEIPIDDIPIMEEQATKQILENEELVTTRSTEVKNRTQNVKRIVKVIVLYEDHTFSEYYPE